MTEPKVSNVAEIVGEGAEAQAATPIKPPAALPTEPFEELIELIARLAAQRRLREAKESLATEINNEQLQHELEKP